MAVLAAEVFMMDMPQAAVLLAEHTMLMVD
jgi:hypothetical protein